jgi:excisionase family DNA binding protein
MNIYHDKLNDFLSIQFSDGVESKSYFKDGMIVREDKEGHVLGIDITDSSQVFASNKTLSLKEACVLLDISESTLRRRIKRNEIPFIKLGNRYRFHQSEISNI